MSTDYFIQCKTCDDESDCTNKLYYLNAVVAQYDKLSALIALAESIEYNETLLVGSWISPLGILESPFGAIFEFMRKHREHDLCLADEYGREYVLEQATENA